MKILIIIFCTVLISTNTISAQEFNKSGTNNSRKFGYSASYYSIRNSSIGWQIGIENYLATTKNFQVIGSLNLSNYYLKDLYTAVALNPKIGFRYTSDFGFVLENSIGFGYLHRFYKYDDYSVNANGDVVAKGKVSQASAMPNITFGFGYNLGNKLKIPLLAIVRAGVNYNYPNRHYIFETYTFTEVGIIYRPTFNK